jgi:diazepam-binding inhibitor (GABA receptor modulator, acyl-CoA-binding protein)
MADLQAEFEMAAQDVQNLAKRPGNDVLLKLYAYYKQATAGDVAGSRPGMTDFAGRAKYDAWSRLKGTSRDQAMQAYIDIVNKLKAAA